MSFLDLTALRDRDRISMSEVGGFTMQDTQY